MIFDKATVIAGIKDQLKPADRSQLKKIDRSLAFALDDYTLKLADSGLLTNYDVPVSANDRSVAIPGENDDLKYLFAVKYGTGDNQIVLTHVDKVQFLRSYDNPNASAGDPKFFMILSNDEGFPVVKFNVPALSATTMTVYYYPDMTAENLGQARSGVAVMAGAVAYFYGIASQVGVVQYALFEKLSVLSKGSDHFLRTVKKTFGLSKFDRNVRAHQSTIRNRRI